MGDVGTDLGYDAIVLVEAVEPDGQGLVPGDGRDGQAVAGNQRPVLGRHQVDRRIAGFGRCANKLLWAEFLRNKTPPGDGLRDHACFE